MACSRVEAHRVEWIRNPPRWRVAAFDMLADGHLSSTEDFLLLFSFFKLRKRQEYPRGKNTQSFFYPEYPKKL